MVEAVYCPGKWMAYISCRHPVAFEVSFFKRKNAQYPRQVPAHLTYASLPPSPYLGRDQIYDGNS